MGCPCFSFGRSKASAPSSAPSSRASKLAQPTGEPIVGQVVGRTVDAAGATGNVKLVPVRLDYAAANVAERLVAKGYALDVSRSFRDDGSPREFLWYALEQSPSLESVRVGEDVHRVGDLVDVRFPDEFNELPLASVKLTWIGPNSVKVVSHHGLERCVHPKFLRA